MPDFRFIDNGSVVTVQIVTDAAKEWAADRLSHVAGWQGSATRYFSVDWRLGRDLSMDIMDEGFTIEGVPA